MIKKADISCKEAKTRCKEAKKGCKDSKTSCWSQDELYIHPAPDPGSM